MCMTDDEQTTSTCYDTESSTGEASADIQSSNLGVTTSGICPRCMMFWILVLVVTLSAIFYFNRRK
jgi:hypothetical protein